MPRSLLLLILFFSSAAGFAQNDYSLRSYSTEDGMPSNGIKGLQWDEETGFLWMATEAGVVRFNGIDFTNFTKENTAGLTSERMLFLVRNYQGRIITSDQSRNIFIVQKNRLLFAGHFQQRQEKADNFFLVGSSDSF